MSRDEVLIVGAGPVGLSLGILLARQGVPFQIIDQTTSQAKDSRAAGIQPRTLEVFEDMEILMPFLQEGVKVVGVNIFSGQDRLLHAVYEGFDAPYPFIIDLPQRETERILIEHLDVNVQRETALNNLELHDTHVEVMLKKGADDFASEEFAYVVGCDGARSTCRKLLEIPFPGSEYPAHWIVLDAKVTWDFDSQEINIFPHGDGIVATFPLPKDRMRITIERKAGDETPPSFELALQRMRERISPAIELEEPADLSPFIIHHRQAASYRKERVFLAGDAAHLHSPAGGQGMNTGIQDAYNLAWKLGLVMKGIGQEALLDTYHKERHPIAKEVLALTDRMTKIMTVKSPALSFIRNAFMTIAGSLDILKKPLPKRLSQLYLSYGKSDIIVDDAGEHTPSAIEVGKRAPDHCVSQNGKEMRLFDLFKGTHHTLLQFGGKKGAHDFYSVSHPEVRTYHLYRDRSTFQTPESLLDVEPSAHTHYGISKPTAVLVRPDGYIGYIQSPLHQKGFETYLQKVFCS